MTAQSINSGDEDNSEGLTFSIILPGVSFEDTFMRKQP